MGIVIRVCAARGALPAYGALISPPTRSGRRRSRDPPRASRCDARARDARGRQCGRRADDHAGGRLRDPIGRAALGGSRSGAVAGRNQADPARLLPSSKQHRTRHRIQRPAVRTPQSTPFSAYDPNAAPQNGQPVHTVRLAGCMLDARASYRMVYLTTRKRGSTTANRRSRRRQRHRACRKVPK